MEGHLRKFHQNSTLFTKELNQQRYVVVDFNSALIKIYKKKPSEGKGDRQRSEIAEAT